MELTLKAILARFDGDEWKAYEYCRLLAACTTNTHLADEYAQHAMYFTKRMAANV